jgi:hypothetical protein
MTKLSAIFAICVGVLCLCSKTVYAKCRTPEVSYKRRAMVQVEIHYKFKNPGLQTEWLYRSLRP